MKVKLQYMADLAEKRGNIETGGEVYGLKSHAGRLILMLATGPGPKAIYEKAHFQQDANFLKKRTQFSAENLASNMPGIGTTTIVYLES